MDGTLALHADGNRVSEYNISHRTYGPRRLVSSTCADTPQVRAADSGINNRKVEKVKGVSSFFLSLSSTPMLYVKGSSIFPDFPDNSRPSYAFNTSSTRAFTPIGFPGLKRLAPETATFFSSVYRHVIATVAFFFPVPFSFVIYSNLSL